MVLAVAANSSALSFTLCANSNIRLPTVAEPSSPPWTSMGERAAWRASMRVVRTAWRSNAGSLSASSSPCRSNALSSGTMQDARNTGNADFGNGVASASVSFRDRTGSVMAMMNRSTASVWLPSRAAALTFASSRTDKSGLLSTASS